MRVKTPHKDVALTYRDRLGLRTPRNLDPYDICLRRFQSSARVVSKPSAIPHITLHIAASSSGKGRRFQPDLDTADFVPEKEDALGLQTGGSVAETKRKRPNSGQDAYFVAKVAQNFNTTAFGIADGVGGWTEHGVDPADFSHGLCSYMAQTAMGWTGGKVGPRELLALGYQKTLKDPSIRAGGTTACVAVADNDGRMHIANLGDSGFLQLRVGTVHHYSDPQTHAFNTPFQMSITPPEILRQASMFGGVPLNDRPDKADLADHMLRHGDVLVLATDGVWDNLDAQEILRMVTQEMTRAGAWERTQQGFVVLDGIGTLTGQREGTERTLQNKIAAKIVGEAKSASLDRKRDGPFAKAWKREAYLDPFHGGKVDDICVLVVIPVDHGKTDQQIKAKL